MMTLTWWPWPIPYSLANYLEQLTALQQNSAKLVQFPFTSKDILFQSVFIVACGSLYMRLRFAILFMVTFVRNIDL